MPLHYLQSARSLTGAYDGPCSSSEVEFHYTCFLHLHLLTAGLTITTLPCRCGSHAHAMFCQPTRLHSRPAHSQAEVRCNGIWLDGSDPQSTLWAKDVQIYAIYCCLSSSSYGCIACYFIPRRVPIRGIIDSQRPWEERRKDKVYNTI